MRTENMLHEFTLDIRVGPILVAEDIRMECDVIVCRSAVRRRDIETGDVLDLQAFKLVADSDRVVCYVLAAPGETVPRPVYLPHVVDAPEWLAALATAHLNGDGNAAMIAALNEAAPEYAAFA